MPDPHALGVYRQVKAAEEDSPPPTPIPLESSVHAYTAHVSQAAQTESLRWSRKDA